jgi:hypothetical protein
MELIRWVDDNDWDAIPVDGVSPWQDVIDCDGNQLFSFRMMLDRDEVQELVNVANQGYRAGYERGQTDLLRQLRQLLRLPEKLD